MIVQIAATIMVLASQEQTQIRTPTTNLYQDISISGAANPLVKEPLYANIINRAKRLKMATQVLKKSATQKPLTRPVLTSYIKELAQLSDQNLKGHFDLKARGTDSDLKCILKGVSIDLRIKVKSLKLARTNTQLSAVLDEISLLLSDNIEVITTPSKVESGLDCVIEFGNS